MNDGSAAAGAAPNRCDERRHDSLNSRENCPGHGVHFKYLQATPEDEDAYAAAGARLRELALPSPRVAIQTGYNTRQVLNYGYTRWDQFFNDRQLLGIGLLSRAIGDLPAGAERDALFVLLSGVLEFNNLFASYKGEGTGAVRHMFSHHVLKPERTPIEANLWGTSKSSGSFLNLFQSRLLRAVDYKAAPFELALDDRGGKKAGRKLFGKSRPMGVPVLDAWPEAGMAPGAVYLSCGDSAATDIPDRTVECGGDRPTFLRQRSLFGVGGLLSRLAAALVWRDRTLRPRHDPPPWRGSGY